MTGGGSSSSVSADFGQSGPARPGSTRHRPGSERRRAVQDGEHDDQTSREEQEARNHAACCQEQDPIRSTTEPVANRTEGFEDVRFAQDDRFAGPPSKPG
jgi:hypothetical protein